MTATFETGATLARHSEPDDLVGPKQLLALIDNTSAVIYMRDLEGRYLLVNREYERLFGVRREDIIGRTDHDLFAAEVADAFRANDLVAINGGGAQIEEVAPGEDGPHTYVTVKFPLVDDQGKTYAVAGISTDITARKRAEEQVRKLNVGLEQRVAERTAELENSSRELDAFAYSVSHDLRAPLRALGGFAEILLEDYAGQLDDQGQQYLHRIHAAAGRMSQLIDDLLGLSRASRVELHREPVDLGKLARGVVAELRDAEPGRSVDVRIDGGLTCMGDSHLIRLALHNLLANAWKFTSGRDQAVIELGARQQDGDRSFFVRDNGAGFDMRYVDKLFVPFQRLHASTEFEGSGIGLAIVYRIVNRHGGRIWAAGAPGQGATLFFTLPSDEQSFGAREKKADS